MTDTAPLQSRAGRTSARGAFTLVELLVVIGIVVLIAGIALPLVMRANRQARQTRIAADLQALATGLDAFKNDHGAYPEVDAANLGAAILGRNLIGPLGDGYLPGSTSVTPDDTADPPAYVATEIYGAGSVVQQSNTRYVAAVTPTGAPPGDVSWIQYDGANDGADGLGIRMRSGGKKFGPYLQEGRFPMRGLAILDLNGNPILYFPARPVKPDIGGAAGYLPNALSPTYVNNNNSLYDSSDNWMPFKHVADASDTPALYRIHAVLGDYNPNGAIDTAAGERSFEQPYLLWSAGADGLYGPITITDGSGTGVNSNFQINRRQADACDDVTNFR